MQPVSGVHAVQTNAAACNKQRKAARLVRSDHKKEEHALVNRPQVVAKNERKSHRQTGQRNDEV